jgi:hypothetical protein
VGVVLVFVLVLFLRWSAWGEVAVTGSEVVSWWEYAVSVVCMWMS